MIYKNFMNIQLSRLGMGVMRLPVVGDDPNGAIDYEKAQEIIDYAMNHGINYYDTAYVYHNGESESFLGKAMVKYQRSSYYLATKFNIDANPDYRTVFEEQLRNLNTDYIDFYLLHGLVESNIDRYLESGCIEYFEEQQKMGRIKYLGFSSHAASAALQRVADYRKWDFAQIQMNYIDWEFSTTKEEYELLMERKIPIMVMEPVRGGRLADLGEELNSRLRKEKPEWSIPSWAFRWLKGKEGIFVCLSGMSALSQIQDNVSVFDAEEALTEKQTEMLKDVANELKKSMSVPCTGCRYCCSECPKGLEIPQLLEAYNMYKYVGWWKGNELDGITEGKRPSACLGCGKCLKHCPQKIEIPTLLAKLKELEENGE